MTKADMDKNELANYNKYLIKVSSYAMMSNKLTNSDDKFVIVKSIIWILLGMKGIPVGKW